MQCEHNNYVVCKLIISGCGNTQSVTFHVIFSRKVIKNMFLPLHYIFNVSIGYLAVCATEIYELKYPNHPQGATTSI